jgi:hypothetical protein
VLFVAICYSPFGGAGHFCQPLRLPFYSYI